MSFDSLEKGIKGLAVRIKKFSLLFVIIISATAFASSQQFPNYSNGKRIGGLKSNLISEASGIAASRQNPGVLWVHNDSGDSARLFAISKSGDLIGIYNITDATANDWEDIAIGPGPKANTDYLYIADIGDNDKKRKSVNVYRVVEPEINMNKKGDTFNIGPSEKIELKYPDGAVNAETLMVEPATGDIYIVTKNKAPAKIYRARYPQSITAPTVLEKIASIDLKKAVGGDISADGKLIIVKTKKNIVLWTRPLESNLAEVFEKSYGSLPAMPFIFELQCEAICFDTDSKNYYTISEGLFPSIFYYEQIEESKSIADSD